MDMRIITEIRQASCPTVVTSFTFYIHLNGDEEKSKASIDNLANIRIDHKRIYNSPDPTFTSEPVPRKIISDPFFPSPLSLFGHSSLPYRDPAPCAAASARHYSKFCTMAGTYRHCIKAFVVKTDL